MILGFGNNLRGKKDLQVFLSSCKSNTYCRAKKY